MKKEKKLLPFNLQFFAEGEDGTEGKDGKPDNNDSGKDEKFFTQEQVTGMMAKEKKEGRKSAFKSLGFDSEEDAQNAIKEFNEYKKTQKTKEELLGDDLKNANSDKQKALERAEKAEQKLSLVSAGVSKDDFDDVLAIAKTKITEDKTLDDVLEDMKKEPKYNSFFGKSSHGSGTGSTPGHGKRDNDDNDNNGSYGETLAKRSFQKETKKSYFN